MDDFVLVSSVLRIKLSRFLIESHLMTDLQNPMILKPPLKEFLEARIEILSLIHHQIFAECKFKENDLKDLIFMLWKINLF